LSAIQELLNAAGNLAPLGEHWRKLTAAAEVVVEDHAALVTHLQHENYKLGEQLAERDRADAELREALAQVRAATDGCLMCVVTEMLDSAVERWAAKGGAK